MSRPAYALAGLLAAAIGTPALAQAGAPQGLAGLWSVEGSVTKLVRVPVLESKSAMTVTRPAWAMGASGSAGSRVIHTMKDKEVPMTVSQEIALGLRGDGKFMMQSSTNRAASPTNQDCRVTTLEEKTGSYRVNGDTLVLLVDSATEHRGDSCDSSGDTVTPMAADTETYSFALQGGALQLSGSGGSMVLRKK